MQQSLAENSKHPLAGLGVLVTRPAHQAENFCQLIEASGGHALRFPVLEIQPALSVLQIKSVAEHLTNFDIAVFVSTNAVRLAAEPILQQRAWPDTLAIAAIGSRTREALIALGLNVQVHPSEQYTSEALLALSVLQTLKGKRILIFRGVGGREFLADTLRQRGAQVDYVEAYRRVQPEVDAQWLNESGARGDIHVITVTSKESLHNLVAMVGDLGNDWLKQSILVVASERIGLEAEHMGFRRPVIVADNATDEAMLAVLTQWVSVNAVGKKGSS